MKRTGRHTLDGERKTQKEERENGKTQTGIKGNNTKRARMKEPGDRRKQGRHLIKKE